MVHAGYIIPMEKVASIIIYCIFP